MASTRSNARRWLIALGVLWLIFLVAVVAVMIARGNGPFGIGQNEADGNDIVAVSLDSTEDADGWFTQTQAGRGGDEYAQHCAQCHGNGLEGGVGPALAGDTFWDRWEGDTVHTLFEVTRQTMPQGAPGSLSNEAYVDITAHILQVNDFPAGDGELPPDEEQMQALTFERDAAGADDGDAEDAPTGTEEPASDADDGDAEDAPTETEEPASGEAAEDAEEPAEPSESEEGPDASDEPDASEPDDTAEAAESSEPGTGRDQAVDVTERAPSPDDEAWFSAAQVEAGSAAFSAHCAACHGADLQGSPPLVGGGFPERYNTVWELFQYVRQTMPQDDPGSLDDETYLHTIAYVLDANGYPTGEYRVEASRARLEDLRLDPELASEPDAETDADDPAAADTGEPGADPADANDDGDANDEADAAEGEASADADAAEGEANDGDENDDANGNGEASDDGEANGNGDAGEAWFTEEQARRGADDYAQHCASCHGDDLQGEPPLTADALRASFDTVWDLYDYTRTQMPQNDPGSLDDDTYADIVAHILHQNDYPAGDDELEADEQALQDMPLDQETDQPDTGAEESDADPAEANDEADADDAEASDDAAADPAETNDDADADPAETNDAERGDADASEADGPEADGPERGRAWLDIETQPANVTINLVGPGGFVGRVTGGQQLRDLVPGTYVVAASRGHQSAVANVTLGSGETGRLTLVLDELSRSGDVPAEPAVPTTEIPAIAAEPDERVRLEGYPLTGAAATTDDTAAAEDADAATGVAAAEPRAPSPARDAGAQLQAERGDQAYALHCARCHGANLEGDVAPALAGEVFFERWGGHPVDWLYFQARAAMPPHGPAFLSEQTYADIIVYALRESGVLDGHEDFRPHDEAFRMLTITPRATADGRPGLEAQVDRLRQAIQAPHDDAILGVGGPLRPIEWPADLGLAPIGPPGRIDAAAAVEAEGAEEADGEPEQEAPADGAENGEAEGNGDADGNGETEGNGETDGNGDAGGEAAPVPADDDDNDDADEDGGARRPATAPPLGA